MKVPTVTRTTLTSYSHGCRQWTASEAQPKCNRNSQRLREIQLASLDMSTDHLIEEFGRLRDVTTAPDGSLWMLANKHRRCGEP